jgi:hypothetical protein
MIRILFLKALLWIRIRIHRIRIAPVLGLLDPYQDPLVRGMDPDQEPDRSIIKPKSKKSLDFYCFVTFF